MTIPQRWVAVFAVFFLLAACSPAVTAANPTSASSAQTDIPPTATPESPTATAASTPAPKASRTPTPQPTMTRSFPSSGPYFAFADVDLVFIGADNQGRKEIRLPDEAWFKSDFPRRISPDGEWIVYWTGSAGEWSMVPLDPDSEYELNLNLFRISNGNSIEIAELLSPDYPDNFEKNASAMKGLPEFAGMPLADVVSSLQESFVDGIRSAAWSPDGRYLAFAGEMDGPSSDLYSYDLSTQSILRLSDGPSNIVAGSPGYRPPIDWSPDGQWIVYSGAYWSGLGMCVRFFAARPEGSASRDFNTWETAGTFYGWISPSAFLTYEQSNGLGNHGWKEMDITTGRVTEIWECSTAGMAYDPEKKIFLVGGNYDFPECDTSGVFMVFPSSGRAERVLDSWKDGLPHPYGFLGNGDRRFLVYTNTGTYAVSHTGETTLILEEPLELFISPDRQWVAFAGQGLRMMDSAGDISVPLTEVQIDEVMWRPDSKGFLFHSGADLYSVSLPDMTVFQWKDVSFPTNVREIYWQPDSQGFFFVSGSRLYFLSLLRKSLESVQLLANPDAFDPVWVAVPE
jgi:WD40 repeat protein